MVLPCNDAEGPDANFEMGNEAGIKVEESYEGVEGLAGGGKGPLADEVEFGRGGAVAVGSEIETDPFDTVKEEVTFLGVKGESPFGEDVADAQKIQDEGVGFVGEKEDVVNNLAITGLDEVDECFGVTEVGKFLAEQGLPFLAKDEHERGVASRSVDGSEGHDVEGVKDTLGPGKAKFGSIGAANANLVETRFCVDADPVQAAGPWCEIIDGFIAAGNGKVVDECDGVEAAIRDAQAPDEVFNVGNVLLVGFGG